MNMRKKPHYSGQRSGGNSGGGGGGDRNNNNKRRFVRKPGGGGGSGGGGNTRYGSGEDADSVNPRMRKQAQTNHEKYIMMGKNALINGDRVESEYYLQHADHYLRIMNAIDAQFAPRQQQQQEREATEGQDAAGVAEPQEKQEMPESPAMEAPQVEAEEEPMFGPNDGAQLASVLPAPRMPRAAKVAE